MYLLVAMTLLMTQVVLGKSCSGNLTVEVSGKYTWQSSNDTAYPSDAHFSPMVCGLSTSAAVFVSGQAASAGVKLLAEEGDPQQLLKELVSSKIAYKTSNKTSSGTAAFTLMLSLSSNATYLFCVSMIAPSPDWIVGIPSMDICDTTTGTYKSKAEYALMPYDAGTDSGKNYTSANSPTSPAEVIKSATGAVIAQYGYIRVTTNASSSSSGDSSGSGDDDDDSSCFPAHGVVELSDGRLKTMNELVIGDHVKTGDNKYSAIYMFTHQEPHGMYSFIRIETPYDYIELSPTHYIYCNGQLVAAKGVRVGDMLQLASGRPALVTRMSMVSRAGLYNPQTVHGDIVVNGIVASTYTLAVKPSIAHAALSIARTLPAGKIHSFVSSLLRSGAPKIAALLPSGATRFDH